MHGINNFYFSLIVSANILGNRAKEITIFPSILAL